MKKTNSMRVAAAMLALTLITSCFVGGTFAKYTTSASGGDSARVAKFGVEVNAGKSAFLDKYETNTETAGEYKGKYSVASSDGAKVVAPGTSGTIDLFTISGNPEVAVKVNAVMDNINKISLTCIEKKIVLNVKVEEWESEMHYIDMGTFKDVIVPIPEKGTPEFDNYYNSRPDLFEEVEEVEESEEYTPIKWTLRKDGAAVVTDGTLDDVKNHIDTNISGVYGPNELTKEIGGTYTLEWKWVFDSGNDSLDTILGNLSAENGKETDKYKYSLDESFDFSITVTQID